MSMKVKRTIHGEEVEIELTKEEVAEAYLVHEHYCDCDTVRGILNSGIYSEFEDLTDEEWETAVDEIAYEKRHQQEKYEMDAWDAFDAALAKYVEDHLSDQAPDNTEKPTLDTQITEAAQNTVSATPQQQREISL